jgi:DNA-binding MarR family transcriptional regulator
MLNEKLSVGAKGLYGIIASLCGPKNQCYPSTSTLARFSGVSRATAFRLLKELCEAQIIERYRDPIKKVTITVNLAAPDLVAPKPSH